MLTWRCCGVFSNEPPHHAHRHGNSRPRLGRLYQILARPIPRRSFSVSHRQGAKGQMIRSLLPLLLAGAAFGYVADDLRKFEGLRLSCYHDTMGLPTCGYGHRCAEGTKMTLLTAEKALADDVLCAERWAKAVFPTFSAQPQHVQDILVELCFQLGASGMRKFAHFGQAIQSRDYSLASACLIDSRFHRQCKQRCETIAKRLNP